MTIVKIYVGLATTPIKPDSITTQYLFPVVSGEGGGVSASRFSTDIDHQENLDQAFLHLPALDHESSIVAGCFVSLAKQVLGVDTGDAAWFPPSRREPLLSCRHLHWQCEARELIRP